MTTFFVLANWWLTQNTISEYLDRCHESFRFSYIPPLVFVPFQTVLVFSLLATERTRDSSKPYFEIIAFFVRTT